MATPDPSGDGGRPGALRRTILLAALANGVLFFHGCQKNQPRVSLGFPVPFAVFETRGGRLFVHLERAVPARLKFFSVGLLAANAPALAALGCSNLEEIRAALEFAEKTNRNNDRIDEIIGIGRIDSGYFLDLDTAGGLRIQATGLIEA